jgi:uncharacterized protein with FMN-binding domain
MRKSIVTILAVAIIGILGIYSRGHQSNDAASVQGADTTVTANPTTTQQTTAASSDSSSSSASSTAAYKDGTYTGDNEDTAYGPVRIQVVISGGRIINIKFVSMPDELGHTQEVTNESAPLLKQSTLDKQSANIDFVSGATQTSEGYKLSLQSALDQAA